MTTKLGKDLPALRDQDQTRARDAIAGELVDAPPRKRTSPAIGRINPLSARISVVLPAPLAPRTATSSPSATSSAASRTTVAAP